MASITVNTRKMYSDVNLAVNDGSAAEQVFNEDSIAQSIVTILSTPVGTRVFNRAFGSEIDGLLWDPMDDITAGKIGMGIRDAIVKWEPRIILVDYLVVPDFENQQYFAQIDYIIPSLGNKAVSFNFNLAKQS